MHIARLMNSIDHDLKSQKSSNEKADLKSLFRLVVADGMFLCFCLLIDFEVHHTDSLCRAPCCDIFTERFGSDRQDGLEVETFQETEIFGERIGATVEG